MFKNCKLILIVLVTVIFIWNANSAENISVIKEWSGLHSGISKNEYYRITDQETFVTIWNRHELNSKNVPLIDFKQYMIIAIFHSRTKQISEPKIVEIKNHSDLINIIFEIPSYQVVGVAAFDDVEPYVIFVIPSSNKKLILTERTKHMYPNQPTEIVVKEFAVKSM